MKKLIFLIILIPVLALGQSQNQNYIKTTTYKTATTTSIASPTIVQASQSVTYFDGLGRPIQQVASKQSASGKNIVIPIEYDAFGRQPKDYLPYATQSTSGLAYETSAFTDVSNFSPYIGQNPYSEKLFEASPLNRVLKQGAPGTDWKLNPTGSDHTIKLDYQTNNGSEVKLFTATATWNATSGLYGISLNGTGTVFYNANELYKTITKDENWVSGNDNTTEEFKNKEGHIILKRTYGVSMVNNSPVNTAHDTYYVYDQYGNLTYVMPPLVTDPTLQLDDLCYQYKYDYRNRLVEKKLPGKQWEFIVYDKLDRPVATGPVFAPFSDLIAQNKVGWMITKYDVFNRPVLTGWMTANVITSAERKILQDAQNIASVLYETKQTSGTIDGIASYYSNTVAPTSFKLLTVNYYDNYIYPNVPAVPTTVEGQNVLVNVKSLSTGSWTRALTLSTEMLGETAATFYDTKARPIRSYSQNYLGGFTQTDTNLDFSGVPQYTITTHKRLTADTELKITERFAYTPQGRLLTHTHQIGTEVTQLLAKNEYDELGQLIVKNVGGIDITGAIGLQKVDYSYNIRGWLIGINDASNLAKAGDPLDLFAFKLNYNTVDDNVNNTVKALFNGNISETLWRTKNDNVLRRYGYQYDGLNRLLNATYQKPDNAVPITNSYNERMNYDKNGNIISLQRNGDFDDPVTALQIDNLSYFYTSNSNRLMKVTDATNNTIGFKDDSNGTNDTADDYDYDLNGNMIKDDNKKITGITYNHLNLPTKITFATTGNIVYIYNAIGQKIKKTVTQGTTITTTDYLDGFQYAQTGTAAVSLQFFPNAEGYVSNMVDDNGVNIYNYVFNYTDHLGNIRLSYTVDPQMYDLVILEENHFYPFGLKHSKYNINQAYYDNGGSRVVKVPRLPYRYKYNGKELQDELGLNMYDYGARFYDPAIGNFWQIDPLAETSRRFSPYSYALDNPVYFIDRDGMYADVKNIQEGNEGTTECCPGLPFGNNPPKKSSPLGGILQDFTPSESTTTMLNEAKELLSNVFDYEGSLSVGESGAVDVQVGPVKADAEITIAEASVKTTQKNAVELEVKGPGLKVGGAVGTAKGSVGVSAGSIKAGIDKKGNVNGGVTGFKGSSSGTLGKDTKLSLSNSLTLSASVKVPTPDGVSGKIGVSANLYNAAVGVTKLIQGGAGYLKDYVSNVFSLN